MTTSGIRPIVIGNWKMNGLKAAGAELDALLARLGEAGTIGADLMICPPVTLVADFAGRAAGSALAIGAQDCHAAEQGAHTGDISAEMLADAGARAVIVGHSERRADHGEDDAAVKAKAKAAHRAGLQAIVCLGESEAERDAGRTLEVVRRQLAGSLPEGAAPDNTIIAYEPVWAIGTGRTPSPDDVETVHTALRAELEKTLGGHRGRLRLLYGGSVKPGNASELMRVHNVDGGLIGGASLKAADLWAIFEAAQG